MKTKKKVSKKKEPAEAIIPKSGSVEFIRSLIEMGVSHYKNGDIEFRVDTMSQAANPLVNYPVIDLMPNERDPDEIAFQTAYRGGIL